MEPALKSLKQMSHSAQDDEIRPDKTNPIPGCGYILDYCSILGRSLSMFEVVTTSSLLFNIVSGAPLILLLHLGISPFSKDLSWIPIFVGPSTAGGCEFSTQEMPADAEPMDQRLGGSTNFPAILGREELNNSSIHPFLIMVLSRLHLNG